MGINKMSFSQAPRCPLCHDMMVKDHDITRDIWVWACHKDKIAINVTDPFVGKWERAAREKIECPNCATGMRLFFTMVGFLLAKCPKCKATIKESNPDRVTRAMTGAKASSLSDLNISKTLDLHPEFKKEIGHA